MSPSLAMCDAVREAMSVHGMTQAEVANRMKARGFKFSQSTVWKILSRARLIDLDEAVALAEVCHIDLPALIQGLPAHVSPARAAAAELLHAALVLAQDPNQGDQS